MIRESFRYLFLSTHPFQNPLARQRAHTILTLNWLVVVSWLVWVASIVPQLTTTMALVLIAASLAFVGVTAGIFLNVKAGRVQFAANLLISLLVFLTAAVLVALPQSDGRFVLVVLVPLALASVFYDRAGIIVTGGVLTLLMLLTGLLYINVGAATGTNPLADLTQLLLIVVVVTAVLSLFANRQQEIAATSLEDIARLKKMVSSVTHVEPGISEVVVLQRATRFLREAFNYDSVLVYLLDADDTFSQRMQLGARGVETLRRSDRTTLADNTAFANALRSNNTLVVTPQDAPTRTRHLLPSTQHGLVVPLAFNGAHYGVIDVQSIDGAEPSSDDLEIVTILGTELSAVLGVLRYIATLQRDLDEQRSVTERLQAQVTGLQAQQRRSLRTAWSSFVQQIGQGSSVGFNLANGALTPATDMPQDMQNALQQGDLFTVEQADRQTIYVPIKLRDDVLGAMTFDLPPDQPITERQRELASTVALRLGSALESTRLLEQTQAQAIRERKASEIANLLITATDVNSLLELAADSFNETLGAIQTQIFIEPKLSPSHNPANNGDST